MDISAFKPFLDALAVQPWMYPVAFAVGIINQFAKGMLRFWTQEAAFGLATFVALACGAGSLATKGVTVPEAGERALILWAVALIAEAAAAAAADKLPFIPKNNEWAGPKPPETPKP